MSAKQTLFYLFCSLFCVWRAYTDSSASICQQMYVNLQNVPSDDSIMRFDDFVEWRRESHSLLMLFEALFVQLQIDLFMFAL